MDKSENAILKHTEDIFAGKLEQILWEVDAHVAESSFENEELFNRVLSRDIEGTMRSVVGDEVALVHEASRAIVISEAIE
jgi:hypothetical protein